MSCCSFPGENVCQFPPALWSEYLGHAYWVDFADVHASAASQANSGGSRGGLKLSEIRKVGRAAERSGVLVLESLGSFPLRPFDFETFGLHCLLDAYASTIAGLRRRVAGLEHPRRLLSLLLVRIAISYSDSILSKASSFDFGFPSDRTRRWILLRHIVRFISVWRGSAVSAAQQQHHLAHRPIPG